MEFFSDSNIDFMKYRKYFVWVSIGLVLLSVIVVFVQGKLNLGIDFAGGTQVTVKFKQKPEIAELRLLMTDAGIGDPVIQQFGGDDANEALIKTSTIPGQEEGNQALVLAALDQRFNTQPPNAFDLNRQGSDALADFLFDLDPDEIRFQDEDLVVSLKPAGRAVHKGTGHPVGWIDAVGAVVGAKLTPVGPAASPPPGRSTMPTSASPRLPRQPHDRPRPNLSRLHC